MTLDALFAFVSPSSNPLHNCRSSSSVEFPTKGDTTPRNIVHHTYNTLANSPSPDSNTTLIHARSIHAPPPFLKVSRTHRHFSPANLGTKHLFRSSCLTAKEEGNRQSCQMTLLRPTLLNPDSKNISDPHQQQSRSVTTIQFLCAVS
jgi:hypothetical protein